MKILKNNEAITAYYDKYYLSEHASYFSQERAYQEVEQLVRWFGGKPNSVCDVACGDGRHLLAFAKMGVLNGYGFDISRELVDVARQTLDPFGYQIVIDSFESWKPTTESADIVYSLFSSIGYCLTDEVAAALIGKMASAAKKGGIVCTDADNIHRLKRYLDNPENADADNEYSLNEQTKILLAREHRGEEILETQTRFYSAEELTRFFESAGLSQINLYGGFDGSAYNEGSNRLIIIGIK